VGGPATHSSQLAAELGRRGHTVDVVTLTDEASTVREPGLVRYPRRWPWPVRTAAVAATLVRRRSEYDVVYASGLDLPAVVGARLARRPVVLKVVGDQAWERGSRLGLTTATFADFQRERPRSVRLAAMRALRAWTARSADAVVTPSAYLQSVIEGWTGGRRPVRVVRNGARPVGDEARRAAPQAPTPGALSLVYVGRLVGLKRIDAVVEAVALTEGITLTVVGDGPEAAHLEDLTRRLQLGARVRFAGPLPHDEAMRLLMAGDALVNASLHEGLPHAAIEALVHGVPVVCAPGGGTAEVVADGRNGLLVDPATPAGLATAFARLRDDLDLRHRLSEGAREDGRTWRFDHCADQLEQLFRDVSAAGRPRAVFVGRGIPFPPSEELRRKFALHSGILRQTLVTTGRFGVHDISGVRVVCLPALRPRLLGGFLFYGAAPLLALALAAGSRRRRDSAVVCQSPYEALGVVALSRLLPARMRPRVQIELHGDWRTAPRLYGSRARTVLAPACDRLCEWSLRRADRVRAVSELLGDQAREAGYTGPVDRHFTFSDFGTFLDRPPAPLPPEPRALFVGVLERYKAVDLLLMAWPDVVAEVPAARLTLVGDGTFGPELRRRAEAAGTPQVEFRLPVSQSEVAALLDGCTCLVLPSRSEGLPRVVMEAMARGRAVVASDVGGMRELVVDGETGRIVPPEDVGALAHALAGVLKDREAAARMGRAARSRAEERDPVTEYEAGIRRLAAWIAAG
jgi:glycosyltransferase involved in cell wall biosynthesis